MIISHKHKFIFLKPRKVGGTSIEINLAKHCGLEDIVTPISQFTPGKDEDKYEHKARNYEEKNYYNHVEPIGIIRRLGLLGFPIWKNYSKYSAVRNPWDLTVSWYWWKTKRKQPFSEFIRKGMKIDNDPYYFNLFGKPIADFYLRYENLDEDYKKLCQLIGIPYEPLLRTKVGVRKNKEHYSTYYNEEDKKLIAKQFQKNIKFFGYKFSTT